MMPSGALSDADFERLASLQCATLPSSLISKLGVDYVRSFYRYALKSSHEIVLAARDDAGIIAAGCVVSLDIATLQRRLLTGTPLLLAALPRAPTLLPQLLRGSSGAIPADAPELLLLFTDTGHRGKGLAGNLVDQAEITLKTRGISRYMVRTFDDAADPALRFYLGKGFVEAGCFTTNGSAFQLLEKRL